MSKTFCTFALLTFAVAFAFETYEYTDSRDNQKYPVIRIDETSIFAKNLNYKSKKSFCYDDNPTNCKNYGRLYTWKEAIAACPLGWELLDENSLRTLIEDKRAYSQFRLTTGGFRNSKGKYELMDKRLDLWLANDLDGKKSKYWFYSTSNNKSDFSSYSTDGAMSVRCVNYFDPEGCNFDCTCDQGIEYAYGIEFQNSKVLVCSYMQESRTGTMNPTCPRGYEYTVRYYKKKSPGKINECPSVFDDNMEIIDTEDIFTNGELVFNKNGLCNIGGDNYEKPEYTNCIPLSRASSKLTPFGRSLFGN